MIDATLVGLASAASLAALGASLIWLGRSRWRPLRACQKCDHLLGNALQCTECGELVHGTRDAHLRARRARYIRVGAASWAVAACVGVASIRGWKAVPTSILIRAAPTQPTGNVGSFADQMAAELARRAQAERSLTEPQIGLVLERQLAEHLEQGSLVSVRPRWPRGLPLRLGIWGVRPVHSSPLLGDGPLVISISSPNCDGNARRTVFPTLTAVFKPTGLWVDHWLSMPSDCVVADRLELRVAILRGSMQSSDQTGAKLAEVEVNIPVTLVESTAEAIQLDSADSLTSSIEAAVQVTIQNGKAWLRVDHARLPSDLSLGLTIETVSDGKIVGRGRLVCDDPRTAPTPYGVELAVGGALEGTADPPPSGRWIRLVGDPELSLSLVGKTRCWSGELLVPWTP